MSCKVCQHIWGWSEWAMFVFEVSSAASSLTADVVTILRVCVCARVCVEIAYALPGLLPKRTAIQSQVKQWKGR